MLFPAKLQVTDKDGQERHIFLSPDEAVLFVERGTGDQAWDTSMEWNPTWVGHLSNKLTPDISYYTTSTTAYCFYFYFPPSLLSVRTLTSRHRLIPLWLPTALNWSHTSFPVLDKMTSRVNTRSIQCVSLNAKGLNNPVKRQKIVSYLQQLKADIAFIQETHLKTDAVSYLKRKWVRQLYHSV